MTETALLGGGCYWCLDAVFRDIEGVEEVVCGFAGGHVAQPTYEQVCGHGTGHAEVVRIRFDPARISYADLLRVFFGIHDPTTKDRQGADIGAQYRSVIFFDGAAQKADAERVMAEIAEAGIWDAPLVTGLLPAPEFWPAQEGHQDYFARTPASGYCRAVIAPKVAKFRKTFADRLKKPPQGARVA